MQRRNATARLRTSIFLMGMVCVLAIDTGGGGPAASAASQALGSLVVGSGIDASLRWDDALDVWGVHGVGGYLGIVMLGIFASTAWNPAASGGVDGLLRGGTRFFLVQWGAVTIASAWAFLFTLGMLWIINGITPVKVSESTEEAGLDEGIHGETAYAIEA